MKHNWNSNVAVGTDALNKAQLKVTILLLVMVIKNNTTGGYNVGTGSGGCKHNCI